MTNDVIPRPEGDPTNVLLNLHEKNNTAVITFHQETDDKDVLTLGKFRFVYEGDKPGRLLSIRYPLDPHEEDCWPQLDMPDETLQEVSEDRPSVYSLITALMGPELLHELDGQHRLNQGRRLQFWQTEESAKQQAEVHERIHELILRAKSQVYRPEWVIDEVTQAPLRPNRKPAIRRRLITRVIAASALTLALFSPAIHQGVHAVADTGEVREQRDRADDLSDDVDTAGSWLNQIAADSPVPGMIVVAPEQTDTEPSDLALSQFLANDPEADPDKVLDQLYGTPPELVTELSAQEQQQLAGLLYDVLAQQLSQRVDAEDQARQATTEQGQHRRNTIIALAIGASVLLLGPIKSGEFNGANEHISVQRAVRKENGA